MKWPKIKIRREAVERALIISSAALVLLLSLKRTSTNNEPYEEPLNEIPEVSVSTTQTEDTRQQSSIMKTETAILFPFSAMLPGKMALPRPRSN